METVCKKLKLKTYVLSKIRQICECSKIAKGIEEDERVRVEVSQTVWRQYAKDLTQVDPLVVKDKKTKRQKDSTRKISLRSTHLLSQRKIISPAAH